jgi:catalase
MRPICILLGLASLACAACPYMDQGSLIEERSDTTIGHLEERSTSAEFLKQFTVDDSESYLTTDAGGPVQDNESLKAGLRGPTLLEDFIYRQKITHFDHERVS